MTIEELIERLEKAAGPDRELDVAIAVAIDGYVLEKRERDRKLWLYREESGPRYYGRKDPEYGVSGEYPRLTSSIDAAVALCVRVLPGMYWSITQGVIGNSPQEFDASVWEEDAPWDALQHRGVHKSAPIALLLAILRAKDRLDD